MKFRRKYIPPSSRKDINTPGRWEEIYSHFTLSIYYSNYFKYEDQMVMEETVPKILMMGLGKMGIPMASRVVSAGLSMGVFSLGGEVRTNAGVEMLKQHTLSRVRQTTNNSDDKSNISPGKIEPVNDLGAWFIPENVYGNHLPTRSEKFSSSVGINHLIITCLPTSKEVKEAAERVIDAVRIATNKRKTFLGENSTEIHETSELKCLIKSLIWIDCTSGDPSVTRQIDSLLRESEISEENIMVDAPVSGGPSGAESGTLCTMIGCDNTELVDIINGIDLNNDQALNSININRCNPLYICRQILTCWTRPAKLMVMGGLGSGHITKAVNNSLLGSHLLLAVEALVLLKKHGIDCKKATDVICSSSGNSLALEDRIKNHVLTGTFNYGFTLSHLVKDMRICRNLLQGYQLPLLEKAVSEANEAETFNNGSDDHTKIVNLSQNRNNVNISN